MRWLLVVCAACSSGSEAAPLGDKPTLEVQAMKDLCWTRGKLDQGMVEDPTTRAYAPGAQGDTAQLTFTYKGESHDTRELAGGQARRQIGLKLRAQDSCNVVYVMWRLDPKPALDISVKRNPGQTQHEQCGAEGYTKVKPAKKLYVPAFEFGQTHTLRAEIVRDTLRAWIDGKIAWTGKLPASARKIVGPAGMRSDNVRYELGELAAVPATGTIPACKHEAGD